MKNKEEIETNARIFGILSILFSIIPLIGIIFGIISTQKGRNNISKFAVKTGIIGITLSFLVAGVVVYLRYNKYRTDKYSNCLEEKSYIARIAIENKQSYVSAMDACEYLRH